MQKNLIFFITCLVYPIFSFTQLDEDFERNFIFSCNMYDEEKKTAKDEGINCLRIELHDKDEDNPIVFETDPTIDGRNGLARIPLYKRSKEKPILKRGILKVETNDGTPLREIELPMNPVRTDYHTHNAYIIKLDEDLSSKDLTIKSSNQLCPENVVVGRQITATKNKEREVKDAQQKIEKTQQELTKTQDEQNEYFRKLLELKIDSIKNQNNSLTHENLSLSQKTIEFEAQIQENERKIKKLKDDLEKEQEEKKRLEIQLKEMGTHVDQLVNYLIPENISLIQMIPYRTNSRRARNFSDFSELGGLMFNIRQRDNGNLLSKSDATKHFYFLVKATVNGNKFIIPFTSSTSPEGNTLSVYNPERLLYLKNKDIVGLTGTDNIDIQIVLLFHHPYSDTGNKYKKIATVTYEVTTEGRFERNLRSYVKSRKELLDSAWKPINEFTQ